MTHEAPGGIDSVHRHLRGLIDLRLGGEPVPALISPILTGVPRRGFDAPREDTEDDALEVAADDRG